ncbi:Polygalacturonase [Apostasia shenzhenica]|uniref:endo-polygalacturonase n=1 Tax=Apostasia shenzhenica TaxID=1088818 RepID=A0A2I0B0M8_9ASPA|nr:Polygalacturonase [Apostasia shenzhenica]
MEAWKEACSSGVPALYLVPDRRIYLLKPITFNGPCKSNITVKIVGTLEASSKLSDWDEKSTTHWVLFHRIENLTVLGGGTINGNGKIWWEHSCKINTSAVTFYSCNNLRVEDLSIKDSQQIHISIEECNNVRVSNLTIDAPEKSPNTDGIHVANTKNMLIIGCMIRTGDDCISIVSGSHNVKAMNIVCGPGHGISIGSLGATNSVANVSDVIVDSATLNGTTNGVRIKTWQGGQGHARNILFQNINMHQVYNPIIIDQNYCDSKDPCHEQKSAVSVSHVIYKNIKGTSASKVAVKFTCSRTLPCQKIKMKNIRLVGQDGGSTESLCKHVKWATTEMVIPPPCANGKLLL